MTDLQDYNRKEYLNEVLAALKETHPKMFHNGKESLKSPIELSIVVDKNALNHDTWSKDVADKLKEKYPDIFENHTKSYIKQTDSRIDVNKSIFDIASRDDGTITLTNASLDSSIIPIDKEKVAETIGLSEDDLTVNIFGTGDALQLKVNKFPDFDKIPANIQDKITETRDGSPLIKEEETNKNLSNNTKSSIDGIIKKPEYWIRKPHLTTNLPC